MLIYPSGTFNEEKDYLATKVPYLYIRPEEHLIDLPYKKLYNGLLQTAYQAVFGADNSQPKHKALNEEDIAKMKIELRKAIDEMFPEKEETEDEPDTDTGSSIGD